MTQYVVQIQTEANGEGVGWLAKSFEVTAENPIPPPADVPANREQVILTNTDSYNGIVAAYSEYGTEAIFSYDEPGGMIDVTGAVTDSWPID